MSQTEFNKFKQIVISTVVAVLLSAGGTALAFYYSTTSRLTTIERNVETKMEKTEFEYFKNNCYLREATIEKKFDAIDKKLDRIENAVYNIKP